MEEEKHCICIAAEKKFSTKTAALLALIIFIVLAAFTPADFVFAAPGINKQIPYQGVLKNSSGANVSDGSYDMVFRIYDVPTGGTALWTGAHTAANGNAVSVSNGFFRVLLGSGAGNAMTLDFAGDTYWLGVTVGADSEMTPRQRIGAAAQAFTSDSVFGAGQSSIGTTTPFSSAELTVEATTTSAIPLAIRGFAGQVADLFRVITDTGTQLLTFTSGGRLGIGTSTPYAKLSVAGRTVGEYFTATSSSATSTFPYLASTQSDIGTVIGGIWNGSAIGEAYGGTGQSAYVAGDILYADGANSLARLATSTAGSILQLDFATGLPSYVATSTLKLALSDTTGTLAVARGGTGTTTPSGFLFGDGIGNLTSTSTIAQNHIDPALARTSDVLTLANWFATTTAPQLTTLLGLTNASTTQLSTSGNFYTALTTGSIPFIGSSGLLTQDNSNLFWDDTNKRLGIGITSPSAALHISKDTGGDLLVIDRPATAVGKLTFDVGAGNPKLKLFRTSNYGQEYSLQINGNGTAGGRFGIFDGADERISILDNGKVGIGTTTPAKALHVNSEIGVGVDKVTPGKITFYNNTLEGNDPYIAASQRDGGVRNSLEIVTTSTNGDIYLDTAGTINFQSNASTKMIMTEAGNFGIGITSPYNPLTVYKSTDNNTMTDLTTALLVLDNNASTGQSKLTFSFGGVAKSGIRGDYVGNFNYHSTGSQGFQFYTSLDTSSPIMGIGVNGVSIGGNAGQTSVNKLDVNGGAAFGTFYKTAAPSGGIIVSGDVGIGTTTPASKLSVSGGASIGANYNVAAPTNGLIVEGSVGIGMISPSNKLEVSGTRSNTIDYGNAIAGIGGNDVRIAMGALAGTPNWGTWIQSQTTADATLPLILNPNGGNVGIGTSSPTGALQIQVPAFTNRDTDNQHVIIGNGGDDDYGIRMGFTGTDGYGIINVLNPAVAWGNLILQDGGGRVGVGTTSPAYKLDVGGSINIANGSTYKINGSDLSLGDLADAQKDTTNNNLFLGGAGFTGTFYNTDNIAIGSTAFDNPNTDGSQAFYGQYNTAVGGRALTNNTTGYRNIAIGYDALKSNTSGGSNLAIGVSTLGSNTTGKWNVVLGDNSFGTETGGTYNVGLGYNTSLSSSSDTNSIVIGANAVGVGSNSVVLGDGNIANTVLRGNVALNLSIGSTASFDLAIGDYDTGIDWVSDGVFNMMANNKTFAQINAGSTNGFVLDVTNALAGNSCDSTNEVLETTANGNIRCGTEDSDEKLKNIIEKGNILYGLDEIVNTPLIRFTWKDQSEVPDHSMKTMDKGINEYQGFSAQELLKTAPELVFEGNDGYYGVDPKGLIATAWNAIRELNAKVDEGILRNQSDSLTLNSTADGFIIDRKNGGTLSVGRVVADKELCVGNTCVTEDQLKTLLSGMSAANGGVVSVEESAAEEPLRLNTEEDIETADNDIAEDVASDKDAADELAEENIPAESAPEESAAEEARDDFPESVSEFSAEEGTVKEELSEGVTGEESADKITGSSTEEIFATETVGASIKGEVTEENLPE